jgi:glutamyl-tRNA synthetase
MTAAPNPSHAARVRTRFAPSPTGFIHLGNIRSRCTPGPLRAATGGDFILRIEDTDVERSTQAAVDVILEGMQWLGWITTKARSTKCSAWTATRPCWRRCRPAGHVYPCYMSVAELDALRERQMAAKEKPRYDGTWRPEPGKNLAARARRRAARAALQATPKAAWWHGTTRSRAASRSATTNSTTW